jgi:hypothetical protein
MHPLTQLQFKLMTLDAQLAAVRRLALCGATAEQIAGHTGWEIQEVQRALRESSAVATPSQKTRTQPRALQARYAATAQDGARR